MGEAGAKAGHRRPVTGASAEGRYPRAFEPGPCSLTKGQKGTWQEKALWGRRGDGSGPVSCAPRATKQRLPQSPDKAQGGCAEGAGASRGERGEAPLPLVSPDLRRKETQVRLGKMAAGAAHRPWGQREPGALRKAGHQKASGPTEPSGPPAIRQGARVEERGREGWGG